VQSKAVPKSLNCFPIMAGCIIMDLPIVGSTLLPVASVAVVGWFQGHTTSGGYQQKLLVKDATEVVRSPLLF